MTKVFNKMQDLSIARQHKVSVMKKAKWALYDKAAFEELIEGIGGMMDSLETLFPTSQADRLTMAIAEAKIVREIKAVNDIFVQSCTETEARDKVLLEALKSLSNLERPSGGDRYQTFRAGDNNAGVQAGRDISNSNFGVGGNSTFHGGWQS